MELIKMDQQLQDLLRVSAKLFEQLSVIPKGEERDAYIEDINQKLDARGSIIETLRQLSFQMDTANKLHVTLGELDKGIRERLEKVMSEIKHDMKDVQNSRKNDKQYSNPYADVRVMDGMYYDRKK